MGRYALLVFCFAIGFTAVITIGCTALTAIERYVRLRKD